MLIASRYNFTPLHYVKPLEVTNSGRFPFYYHRQFEWFFILKTLVFGIENCIENLQKDTIASRFNFTPLYYVKPLEVTYWGRFFYLPLPSVRVIFYFKNASFWNRKLYREPLEEYNRFSIQFYSIALRKTTRSDVLMMIFLLLPSSVFGIENRPEAKPNGAQLI